MKHKTHLHSEDYGAPTPNNEYGDDMEQEQQSSARCKALFNTNNNHGSPALDRDDEGMEKLEMMEIRA